MSIIDRQFNKKKKKKKKKVTFFFSFIFTAWKRIEIFFTKPNLFDLVLSLLSDYTQGNTAEKDFQILIKSNFINI